MKKLNVLIILSVFIQTIALSQSCLPEGIIFTTQEQIDNFQTDYPGCTEIEGDVLIIDDISNLHGLSVLISVGGNLSICTDTSHTTSLINLVGLNNITSVGGNLSIWNQYGLSDLYGLESLSSIGGNFTICYNRHLLSLTGVENLNFVGGSFELYVNYSITNLSGIEGVTSLGAIDFSSNNSLSSIASLENTTSVAGMISIRYLQALTSLEGIDNIDGGTISNLYIYNNSSLSTCNVQSVCDYLSDPGDYVVIENNLPGCNSIGEVETACINSVPCLPEGITFTNQSEVENFQTNYPGCRVIGGDVTISGDNIIDLTPLDVINAISGDLTISNNGNLSSLNGLENIDALSIENLYIFDNISLSECEVQSICDYLYIPSGVVEIYSNNSGCNNQEEIEVDCIPTTLSCLYNGITINTQSEIDSFHYNYPFCTEIEGDLIILSQDITNLDGLNVLTSVGGDLNINSNYKSMDLSGLSNIINVNGELSIVSDTLITDLMDFNNLIYLGGGITVNNCKSLISLNGLENLTGYVSNVILYNNEKLYDLSSLNSITEIYVLEVVGCNSLINLADLQNIEQIQWLKLMDNNSLVNLTGLEKLTQNPAIKIHGNSNLISLLGLNNITGSRTMEISNNAALTNLSGLDSLSYMSGRLEISNNNALVNLEGLNNLSSINYGLLISNNDALSSVYGLNGLTRSDDGIVIKGNNSLLSLESFGNVNTTYMDHLHIFDNNSLSICNSAFVCDYLNNDSTSEVLIYNNSIGCNNPFQVISSCNGSFTPCIPEGKTFTTQYSLDEFYLNHPECTEIAGDVIVSGEDIIDLSVFHNLISFGADLKIYENNSLVSLYGLDSIVHINGNLHIGNNRRSDNSSLKSIKALNNLTSINGGLVICNNDSLMSLEGIENIDPTSIANLTIRDNVLLSDCNVASICNYLSNQINDFVIHDNAFGCSNESEIISNCVDWISNSYDNISFVIYPNPTSEKIYIINKDNFSINFITIYNQLGEVLLQKENIDRFIDVSKFKSGMYIIELTNDKFSTRKKLIIK